MACTFEATNIALSTEISENRKTSGKKMVKWVTRKNHRNRIRSLQKSSAKDKMFTTMQEQSSFEPDHRNMETRTNLNNNFPMTKLTRKVAKQERLINLSSNTTTFS